jgi:hypothetical protein
VGSNGILDKSRHTKPNESTKWGPNASKKMVPVATVVVPKSEDYEKEQWIENNDNEGRSAEKCAPFKIL